MRLGEMVILFVCGLLIAMASTVRDTCARPPKSLNALHRDCKFCHLSYGSSASLPATGESVKPDPFSSPKGPGLKNKIQSSKLCLGCHDGMIAQDAAAPERDKIPSGVDPGRSHPVSVDYTTAFFRKAQRKLRPPSMIEPLKLFDGKVECATCHDTHRSFQLRISKRDLCLRCHNV